MTDAERLRLARKKDMRHFGPAVSYSRPMRDYESKMQRIKRKLLARKKP